jgi:nitrite reductase/ring-hydroxylating ferredoxin subunit
MCPHKRAFVLSSSIVGSLTSTNGSSTVTIPKIACPNHKKAFSLENGKCVSSDEPYAIATFAIRRIVETDRIEIRMPESKEADHVLGTERWRVRPSSCSTKLPSPATSATSLPSLVSEKTAVETAVVDIEGYKSLWDDTRSRRGKYEGTMSVEGHLLEGDIGALVGGQGASGNVDIEVGNDKAEGWPSGGCGGNKKLEW